MQHLEKKCPEIDHGDIKVIHNDVKPFLNETVKKICFHVDL